MIVTSTVAIDPAASEEPHQVFEGITTGLSLHDVERRADLPLESHLVIPIDRATEAALSIDEPHDPSCSHEPFLLVFRTLRIFTAHP